MSDTMLDDLSRDLKPVKPLRLRALWFGAAAGLLLAVLYVALVFGVRPELTGLMHGKMPVNTMAMAKPLVMLICGLSALWAVGDLARPEGRLRLRTLLPALIAVGLVIGLWMSEFALLGPHWAMVHLRDPAKYCYISVFCGGTAGLVVLWRFWLRRSASSHPIVLGAMAGLAASSLMAAAYALHCDRDAPVYILGVYGLSLAVVSGIAALLGGKLLKW